MTTADHSVYAQKAVDAPLGRSAPPAPSARAWAIGAAAALAAHLVAAIPFLPKVDRTPIEEPIADLEGVEIGVRLAPVVQPPETAPPPPPEPEPEPTVIEERASDSPPPAPPAIPRETPDLPDIRPQAVPEIWFGGSGGGGDLSLEEYLRLRDWLAEARLAVLSELSYPEAARRAGESGVAEVVIITSRDGRIIDWYFEKRTGSAILDREITRSIGDVRRLPRFPEGTPQDQLAFKVPIRFELVFEDRRRGGEAAPAGAPSPGAAPAAPAPAPQAPTLTAAQLRSCAASAATLSQERAAIEAKREELETLRTDYEQRAERYTRDRQDPPLSVRRLLTRYNREIEAHNVSIAEFQTRARAFQSVCGGGSTNYENYVAACQPYAATGNQYCEAFGDLWSRLAR